MSLLFNTWSRFVTAFLPRSNHPLISWLQSPSTEILETKKMKSVTAATFSPSICYEVMRPDAMVLVFLIFSFKPTLSLSTFTLIKRLFSSSLLSAIRMVSSAYLKLLMFLLPILVHVMLTPSMQDFKHDLTSMGDECNCPMVWTFFSTTLLGKWDED